MTALLMNDFLNYFNKKLNGDLSLELGFHFC